MKHYKIIKLPLISLKNTTEPTLSSGSVYIMLNEIWLLIR